MKKISDKSIRAAGDSVRRLVRQDGWISTGAVVAARLGLIPKSQIAASLWPHLGRPKEWHHAKRNGKTIRESWWTAEAVESARRANKASKRRAKRAAKKSLPNIPAEPPPVGSGEGSDDNNK